MATAENVQAWSKTAATNSSADSSINWAEGQDPGTVNNSARSMMAAEAKYADDLGGALVAGGTSTALTVTTNQVLSSGHIANGLRLAVRTASAATGAATIAIDGLTAVDIKKNNGTAIVSGDWASGALLDLIYSSTASAFIAANLSGSDSTTAAFRAYNSTNQSISSNPKDLTWDTEVFDIGGYFASSLWTPPSGIVIVGARVQATSVTAGTYLNVYIYKNGSSLVNQTATAASTTVGVDISVVDQANGTDYYGIYVGSLDAGYTMDGGSTGNQFWGTRV